jgi:hypothetical protein
VPPNIKCNPAKKGSYGNNWGKLLGPEFPYMPEPTADKQKQITAERLEHNAKMGDRNPFKASFPPTHMRPPKVFEWIPAPAGTIAPQAKEESDRKPFYPSKAPRKGYNSTINKFPEHAMDNFEDVLKAQRAAAAAEREKLEARGAFKASMRAKSLPVIPVRCVLVLCLAVVIVLVLVCCTLTTATALFEKRLSSRWPRPLLANGQPLTGDVATRRL